jgi:glycine cleavage system H protein
MGEKYFSEDHEWIEVNGDAGTIGISDYAQEQLGDVVFIDLPEIGKTISAGDELAVVESVKAASDVYSPVSASITEVNETLNENPQLVNEDAEGKGWFARVKLTNSAELEKLMKPEDYNRFTESLG